ncbi:MAG: hypothetical protein L0I76_20430 [Pseudonocardia sp.]|nr:hypothetical protein [Pseudonocardia sp.]
MTVVETLLTFVVAPGVLLGAIGLLTSAGSRRRRARYKVGDAWPYEPLFWTANPEGAHLPGHAGDTAAIGSGVTKTQDTRGGTGGKW